MKRKAGKASSGRPGPKIDPRLTQAMSESSGGDPIDAVIMFRDQGKAATGTGKSRSELAVQKLAEQERIEYNFFPLMGAVAVRADIAALKKLLALPGVDTATVGG
jgi:hypothetical protein